MNVSIHHVVVQFFFFLREIRTVGKHYPCESIRVSGSSGSCTFEDSVRHAEVTKKDWEIMYTHNHTPTVPGLSLSDHV